ncbi:MAG: T9SS type A sorting domain-containing protein [Bacteroidales bacterium]|nr:T9SS type A sorting domain-containing protein [Bacteroidales bacterium]
MKRSEVLPGLFAGIMTLIGGVVNAQADPNFVELGPVNVGGHVTSLVVDSHDGSNSTVFAGAATGGVYVMSGERSVLEPLYARQGKDLSLADNSDIWHYVPRLGATGLDTVLPVSCMVQTPDNSIIIGTGSDEKPVGSTFKPMSVMGRGIYILDPSTFEYTLLSGTVPSSLEDDFAAVRRLDYIKRDDSTYLFAVTKGGIYRWVKADSKGWNEAVRAKVFTHDSVDQFVMARQIKVAYFSVGSHLYKIGDATAAQLSCIDISSSLAALNSGVAIKMAVAPSDASYLYVMVINEKGLMDALYLTRDLQKWTRLTTSTVTPFTRSTLNGVTYVNGDGRRCGTIAVSPTDPVQVCIAGTTVWSGRGYLPNAYYQWTKSSYSEQELNRGNYTSSAYGISGTSNYFVHSGIHQIVPVNYYGDLMYYVATDGGVFMTDEDFTRYTKLNRGLNNLQINSVAVSPDGSVLSGAHNNGCPMIEAREAHDGGTPEVAWYDDGTHGNLNHDANVLWEGNGTQVAASMFQGILPQDHRTIFVSSEANRYGRSYADYLDYTNTQTWTIGGSFLSTDINKGNPIRQLYLWETAEDSIFNDSLTVSIDTLGYVLRYDSAASRYDTVKFKSSQFQIKEGDKMYTTSRAFGDYPIEFTFKKDQLSSEKVRVKNPLQARLLTIGPNSYNPNYWTVFMTWRATDFSKVWDTELAATHESQLRWAGIYVVDTAVSDTMARYSRPRAVAMSTDGSTVFIAVHNRQHGKSMVVRVRGFENIDFSGTQQDIWAQMQCPKFSGWSRLTIDTLHYSGSEVWMPRVVSSISPDSTGATERMVLTFEDYSSDFANVAYINDAKLGSWSLVQQPITGNVSLPAYCSMVEGQTGNVYVGTADGIWINNGTSWSKYPHLNGVPVTSIVQQKAHLAVQRHVGHNGINEVKYLSAKTKWPGAIYIGTYGRGIFLDMTYVSDTVNEISDPQDYNNLAVPVVEGTEASSIHIYPNPVSGVANIDVNAAAASGAMLKVYDLSGRCVLEKSLGQVAEGHNTYSISTEGMGKGMYLVNVSVAGQVAAAKMMVR